MSTSVRMALAGSVACWLLSNLDPSGGWMFGTLSVGLACFALAEEMRR